MAPPLMENDEDDENAGDDVINASDEENLDAILAQSISRFDAFRIYKYFAPLSPPNSNITLFYL